MELTPAEKKAIEAQSLASFPINVQEIRRTVSLLLSEFGRYGFFNEYTIHNFDHVHEMLKCLDWLIPADTSSALSKGDWLFLTLACYFHDLGLLITRDEFEKRHQSGFDEFCQNVLFSGPDGPDYHAKVDELPVEERDTLLYQEFVRHNHAARVRAWITGTPNLGLGAAQAVAAEVNWPAPGFEDTELGALMEPEVSHAETEVYAGVQA
jgi:molecular chaperone HtpG